MQAARRARRINRRAKRKGISTVEYMANVILNYKESKSKLICRKAVDVAAEWGW